MHHIHHTPYRTVQISPEAAEFISKRVTISTAAEIFRDLRAAKLPGVDLITQKQVYFRWRQANQKLWKRAEDEFESASLLLAEENVAHATYVSGRMRGLAIYEAQTISRLKDRTKELLMDATYGTNNSGMELFTVLAEVDGTGTPLAYCFVQKRPPAEGQAQQANPGALGRILEQSPLPLKDAGFQPAFFGTDKDQSEIGAIQMVWPTVKVQLCLWHAKRAIRKKLKDSTQTRTSYDPTMVPAHLPGFEICWASTAAQRPEGDHRERKCQCTSRDVDYSSPGRMESSSVEERDAVLTMFARHFNAHPHIPTRNGALLTTGEIYYQSVVEVYQWCRSKGYPRLWTYLFTNWYKASQWAQWARAANEHEIPVLKTTMIVESHWRRLKHDYLHRFNRPRVDLVLWILLSRVLPDSVYRMNEILEGGSRCVEASWRKVFKRQWKASQKQVVDERSIRLYHTNPTQWTCACESFLLSRFMFCKHLVHCFTKVPVGPQSFELFSRIRRQRAPPFWVEPVHLVILDAYKPATDLLPPESSIAEYPNDGEDFPEPNSDAENDSDSASESQTGSDANSTPSGNSVSSDGHDESRSLVASLEYTLTKVKEATQKGKEEFVKDLAKRHGFHQIMLNLQADIDRIDSSRTMPTSWGNRKHGSSLYYQ